MCCGAVSMEVVFLLIALGMTASVAQEERKNYDGVRYSVFSRRVPWGQAVAACRQQQSALATPTNYHHAAFLAIHGTVFGEVWLGARSSGGGSWLWQPSGPALEPRQQPNLFPPWATPPPPLPRLCLALRRTSSGLPAFLHHNCSRNLGFVCQQPVTGPPGWREHSTQLDGRLYSFRPKPATWDRAQNDCQLMGASLVAMTDHNSTAFIAEHARYVALMWLGARRSAGGWNWTSSLESVPPQRRGRAFPLWAHPGQRGHDCLAVDLRNPRKPVFVPRPCNDTLFFACERADRDFQHYIKTILLPDRKIILIEERQSFDDAAKTCAQYEGALATLNKPHLLKIVQPHSKSYAELNHIACPLPASKRVCLDSCRGTYSRRHNATVYATWQLEVECGPSVIKLNLFLSLLCLRSRKTDYFDTEEGIVHLPIPPIQGQTVRVSLTLRLSPQALLLMLLANTALRK